MGKREVQTRKRENKGQEQSSPVAGILASHPFLKHWLLQLDKAVK